MPTRNPFDDINGKSHVPVQRSKNARTMAMRLRAKGHTLSGIAKELAAIGYCNKRGEPYHKSTIHHLINGMA